MRIYKTKCVYLQVKMMYINYPEKGKIRLDSLSWGIHTNLVPKSSNLQIYYQFEM